MAGAVEMGGSSSQEGDLEPLHIDEAIDVTPLEQAEVAASPEAPLSPPSPISNLTMSWAGVEGDEVERPLDSAQDVEADLLPSVVSPTLMRFEPTSPRTHLAVESAAPQIVTESQQTPTPVSTEDPADNSRMDGTAPCTSRMQEQASTLTLKVEIVPSPIAWRPAEEVLPTEADGHPSRSQLQVYIKRRRGQDQTSPLPGADPPSPAQPPSQPAASQSPHEAFIARISKPLGPALPPPTPQRRRRQAAVVSAPPRRSR